MNFEIHRKFITGHSQHADFYPLDGCLYVALQRAAWKPMWTLDVNVVQLLTGHAPSLFHRWAAQWGPPSLPHFCTTAGGERAVEWAGGGSPTTPTTPCARLPHPPHVKRSSISETVTALSHTHVPLARNPSKQSVDEAFVLAITQPSVTTVITTVEQDDTQLWRRGRRFFYFYFLKSGAAVTTQKDPREGFFLMCMCVCFFLIF